MSNDESNLGNVVAGTFFGALAGGGLGLGACIFFFDDPPLFAGDTILIGAILCGALGFFLGAGFIECLRRIGGDSGDRPPSALNLMTEPFFFSRS